jgi:hypothetical protein
MIYMWFTCINYYKLAVEKDRDSIFTTMWKPGSKTIYFQISCRHTCLKHMEGSLQNNYGLTTAQYGRQMIRTLEFKNLLNSPIFLTMATSSRNDQTCFLMAVIIIVYSLKHEQECFIRCAIFFFRWMWTSGLSYECWDEGTSYSIVYSQHSFYFILFYLLCHHTYTFIGWETTTAIANYSGPNSYTETIYKVY